MKKSIATLCILLCILLNSIFSLELYAEENIQPEKEVRIEYVYKIYQNQTGERIKKFIESLVSSYMKLDTFFFSEIPPSVNNDINFVKLKRKFHREIAFIKGLREKEAGLTQIEERMFFPQIVYSKEKTLINRWEWWEYEEEIVLSGKISGVFNIKINTKTGKIEVFKKNSAWEYAKNYSGRTDIPKNTTVYKTAVLQNNANDHLYLVVWFFSDSGIWTNILSISGGNNIDLISNVTGLLINNNPKYNFETTNCYQDYSYLIVKEKTLKLLCLDKKNDTIIRERSLIN